MIEACPSVVDPVPALAYILLLASPSCDGSPFSIFQGMHAAFSKIKDMDLHVALTLEGREDTELPEQALCAVQLKNLAIAEIASEVEL